jgi:hypothetical protein
MRREALTQLGPLGKSGIAGVAIPCATHEEKMKTRKLTWVAVLTLFAAVSPRLVAQSPQAIFRVVYTFPGGTSGSMPATGVIRDSAGNLYGTTYYCGDLTCNGYLLPGCGIIFKLDKAGRGGGLR